MRKPNPKRLTEVEAIVEALPAKGPEPTEAELDAQIVEGLARIGQHDQECRAVGTYSRPKRMSEKDVREAERFAKSRHESVFHYLSHDEVTARVEEWAARLPEATRAKIAARTEELIKARADDIAASKASTLAAKTEGLRHGAAVAAEQEKAAEDRGPTYGSF